MSSNCSLPMLTCEIYVALPGDLWSGGEGGIIKIWPWESIEKSLSLKPEEKHMAALLVERDARTKELLRVFNIEGQIENRVDTPQSVQDQPEEDEMKVKFVSTLKKEKSQGTSFLQWSRNAIMGAADAVRRVTTRGAGAFVEDNKRTEALVISADGMFWSGCTNGLLVQWDGNGNHLQDVIHHPYAVQCICTYGTRIYVGYVSGYIQILDLEGNLIASLVAHSSPVIKLAVGKGYIYSLATHGGIRGWSITSPGPLDNLLRSELAAKEAMYSRRDNIRILIGTWNVGQGRASHDSLMSWLGSVSSDVGIIAVGLQEVEMGAGFLAMTAAKETNKIPHCKIPNVGGLEGSAIGQWWQDTIGKALEEGTTFERYGVRKNLRTHVGDVDAAAVPCGFGRAIGNKLCMSCLHLLILLTWPNQGGVGLRIRVYDRTICFVNCQLAGMLILIISIKQWSSADQQTYLILPPTAPSSDQKKQIEKDQLRAEMKAGKVFQGMREALIRFPPTYKFERNRPGLAGYDSGEKKRIPDSRTGTEPVSDCSLDCPVVSSVLLYDACMDVTESDHKPVQCKFHVKIAHADRSVRRQAFGEIMKSNETVRSTLDELSYVNTETIVLQNQDTYVLRITNKSLKDKAFFKIICEGQSTVKEDEETYEYRSRGSFGFPRWLEVTPAAGMIKPEYLCRGHEEFHTVEEFVDGIPQNWWCEDTRDTRHQVRVRHCFSAKSIRMDSKSNGSKKAQAGGSSLRQLSSGSSEAFDEQRTPELLSLSLKPTPELQQNPEVMELKGEGN
ncbi:hypothetical protein EZV62_001555 [Acer yangbiense]|uniref:Inositol polyphosphate-related phosphatase domain-containing protein n=1 Tax=Acer yangbiense TaxID=1000413 RepID=A0A5C7IWU3_9ROSI|nr:hypothetical protein EZV62_001555 [Acer yangbiense]